LSRNPSFKLNAVLAVVTRSRDKPAVFSDNTAEASNTEKPTNRRRITMPATGANLTGLGLTDLVSKTMHAYASDSYFADETNATSLNLLDGIWWQGDVNFFLTVLKSSSLF